MISKNVILQEWNAPGPVHLSLLKDAVQRHIVSSPRFLLSNQSFFFSICCFGLLIISHSFITDDYVSLLAISQKSELWSPFPTLEWKLCPKHLKTPYFSLPFGFLAY